MCHGRYVMPLSPIEREILEAIEPILQVQGCELVRVHVSCLPDIEVKIFVDNSCNKSPICVEKLKKIHLLIQDFLPVMSQQKLLPGAYHLQVSSPGLNRPLTRLQHFQNALGKPVCVRFTHADRKKSQTGVLLDVQESGIVLKDLDELAARSLLLQWHEMQEVVLNEFSYRAVQKGLAAKSSTAVKREKLCRK